MKSSNKNVIVFGPSGSGKSYSVAGPQLLQFNSNYVLSDPKGELLQEYGNVLLSQGYKQQHKRESLQVSENGVFLGSGLALCERWCPFRGYRTSVRLEETNRFQNVSETLLVVVTLHIKVDQHLVGTGRRLQNWRFGCRIRCGIMLPAAGDEIVVQSVGGYSRGRLLAAGGNHHSRPGKNRQTWTKYNDQTTPYLFGQLLEFSFSLIQFL